MMIFDKYSPHLGDINDNGHDLISAALTSIPHETLPEFYNHVINLQNTIISSLPGLCCPSNNMPHESLQ
jgi:hypothetical protein